MNLKCNAQCLEFERLYLPCVYLEYSCLRIGVRGRRQANKLLTEDYYQKAFAPPLAFCRQETGVSFRGYLFELDNLLSGTAAFYIGDTAAPLQLRALPFLFLPSVEI
jgi:hypothetical protein